ncbi:hypothetical protein Q1695_002296 [Nippostrongylus brasiliensis]|nr:hypothetical protein Q1695_002296 [Nippostrongylus brasiliensis]
MAMLDMCCVALIVTDNGTITHCLKMGDVHFYVMLFYTKCLLRLILQAALLEASMALSCNYFGPPMRTVSDFSTCVYFVSYPQKNSCGGADFDAIGANVTFSEKDQRPLPMCGGFNATDGLKSRFIAACFCNTDNCNNDAYVMNAVFNETNFFTSGVNITQMSTSQTWMPLDETEQRAMIVNCLDCYAKNLCRPVPQEEGNAISWLTITLIVVGVLIFVGVVAPVAYHYKEQYRKKRLAATWEQRVREAAMDMELQSSLSATSTGSRKSTK